MRYAIYGVLGVTVTFFVINLSTGWTVWQRGLVVVVYAFFVMVQSGFTPAALAFLADVAGQSSGRGSAMGLYTVLLSLGNILGAALGGVLAARYAINGLLYGTVLLAAIAFFSLSYLSDVVHAPHARPSVKR
jgi:predicted MFS family arabinose efflux permease